MSAEGEVDDSQLNGKWFTGPFVVALNVGRNHSISEWPIFGSLVEWRPPAL
jgi:hypothetical protein